MGNVPEDVARILGPGEQVQLFIQQKIYHPKISVDSVVLTNERIILRHPHDLRLKKDFTDFSYTDVANAVLDKGVLRSDRKSTRLNSSHLVISYAVFCLKKKRD